jgi:hypothetical protein
LNKKNHLIPTGIFSAESGRHFALENGRLGTSVSMVKISGSIIRNLIFAKPNTEEQCRILKILKKQDLKISKGEETQKNSNLLKPPLCKICLQAKSESLHCWKRRRLPHESEDLRILAFPEEASFWRRHSLYYEFTGDNGWPKRKNILIRSGSNMGMGGGFRAFRI